MIFNIPIILLSVVAVRAVEIENEPMDTPKTKRIVSPFPNLPLKYDLLNNLMSMTSNTIDSEKQGNKVLRNILMPYKIPYQGMKMGYNMINNMLPIAEKAVYEPMSKVWQGLSNTGRLLVGQELTKSHQKPEEREKSETPQEMTANQQGETESNTHEAESPQQSQESNNTKREITPESITEKPLPPKSLPEPERIQTTPPSDAEDATSFQLDSNNKTADSLMTTPSNIRAETATETSANLQRKSVQNNVSNSNKNSLWWNLEPYKSYFSAMYKPFKGYLQTNGREGLNKNKEARGGAIMKEGSREVPTIRKLNKEYEQQRDETSCSYMESFFKEIGWNGRRDDLDRITKELKSFTKHQNSNPSRFSSNWKWNPWNRSRVSGIQKYSTQSTEPARYGNGSSRQGNWRKYAKYWGPFVKKYGPYIVRTSYRMLTRRITTNRGITVSSREVSPKEQNPAERQTVTVNEPQRKPKTNDYSSISVTSGKKGGNRKGDNRRDLIDLGSEPILPFSSDIGSTGTFVQNPDTDWFNWGSSGGGVQDPVGNPGTGDSNSGYSGDGVNDPSDLSNSATSVKNAQAVPTKVTSSSKKQNQRKVKDKGTNDRKGNPKNNISIFTNDDGEDRHVHGPSHSHNNKEVEIFTRNYNKRSIISSILNSIVRGFKNGISG